MSCASWCNLSEDKKCRICGLADISNVNIFRDKILQTKISTVYPIILLPDDPLPRNICRKCVGTVSSTYNDIQKVVKLQRKWTQNVRANEPGNSFLQALDVLENATEAIKNVLTAAFGKTFSSDTIKKQITAALSEVGKTKETQNITSADVLPLNGDNRERLQIKEEPINDEDGDVKEDNMVLSKFLEIERAKILDNEKTAITCPYCSLKFESLERLSLHQSSHLRVRISKLFQNKYLNKKSRRGRLITINKRQSIRCLNCWRIFDDNKCILEHWSNAECDFYCHICGKEFEQSPKQLREHILDAHGVSYKSLKAQRDRIAVKAPSPSKSKQRTDKTDNKNLKNKKNESILNSRQVPSAKINVENPKYLTTAATRHSNKLVVCRICSRTFQNFKACNSHMRAHKPPYAYGETVPLPDVDADAYMESEQNNDKAKISSSTTITPQNTETAAPIKNNDKAKISSSTTITPQITETAAPIQKMSPKATSPEHTLSQPTAPTNSNVAETSDDKKPDSNTDTKCNTPSNTNACQPVAKMTTSTAPRGIRMKFVSRRSDLNGSIGPSIKVKSLSDLQGGQKTFTIPPQLPKVNEVQNILSPASPTIPININTTFISPHIKNEALDHLLS